MRDGIVDRDFASNRQFPVIRDSRSFIVPPIRPHPGSFTMSTFRPWIPKNIARLHSELRSRSGRDGGNIPVDFRMPLAYSYDQRSLRLTTPDVGHALCRPPIDGTGRAGNGVRETGCGCPPLVLKKRQPVDGVLNRQVEQQRGGATPACRERAACRSRYGVVLHPRSGPCGTAEDRPRTRRRRHSNRLPGLMRATTNFQTHRAVLTGPVSPLPSHQSPFRSLWAVCNCRAPASSGRE